MLRGAIIKELPERKSQRGMLGLIAVGLIIAILPTVLVFLTSQGAPGWLP